MNIREALMGGSLLLSLAATEAMPQQMRHEIQTSNAISEGDTLELIMAQDCHSATLHYTNSAAEISNEGVWTVEVFCSEVSVISVTVQVLIGGMEDQQRETAVIEPANNYVAIPPEIKAHDGETVSALIVLPMY